MIEHDDYLLSQIDEFREKALQLQSLLITKETRARELQSLVDEREGKAEELQQILEERQEKVDGITAVVSKQIDEMLRKVSDKMEEVSVGMSADWKDSRSFNEGQFDRLKETLEQANAQLGTIQEELSSKIHSENVKCYRNVQDLFKGVDEQMEQMPVLQKQTSGIRKLAITSLVVSILNFAAVVAVLVSVFVLSF